MIRPAAMTTKNGKMSAGRWKTGWEQGGGNVPIVVQTFNQISQSAGYKDDEVAVNLTVCGGSYGGGSEVLVVETLVFDEGQITCPTNGLNPKWGGNATQSPGTPDGRS